MANSFNKASSGFKDTRKSQAPADTRKSEANIPNKFTDAASSNALKDTRKSQAPADTRKSEANIPNKFTDAASSNALKDTRKSQADFSQGQSKASVPSAQKVSSNSNNSKKSGGSSNVVVGESVSAAESASRADVSRNLAQTKASLKSGESININRRGQGVSISDNALRRREILDENRDFTFQNMQGQGFSADPNIVAVNINDSFYGRSNITYASGRKEDVFTGESNLYGKKVDSTSPIFKKEKTTKQKVVDTGLKIVGSVDKGIDTTSQYGGILSAEFVERANLNNDPLSVKFRGYKRDYDYEKIRNVGRIGTKVGLNVGTTLISGGLIGKAATKILPLSTLKLFSNKAVVYPSLGVGIGVSANNVRKSSSKVETGLVEVARLGGGTKGLQLGIKSSKNVARVLKNKPSVEVVEGFKSKSESFDFGKNILLNDVGVVSSQSKSVGGGLYKVGNKFFKVSFTDVGKSQNINDNTKLLRSKSILKIQKYVYGVDGFDVNKKFKLDLNYLRAGVGRPSSASLDTKGLLVSSDTGFNLESVSKVSSKGLSFERLSRVKGVRKDLRTNILGESVDVKGGKSFNKNILKGQVDIDLEVNQKALSGEDFTFTKATSKNVGVGKSKITGAISKEFSDIKKNFGKNEFVFSSNTLVGLQSSGKSVDPFVVNDNLVKSILSKKVVQSDSRKLRSELRDISKSIKAKAPAPLASKSESSSVLKPSVKSKSSIILSSSKSLQKINSKLGSSSLPKFKSDSSLKSVPSTKSRRSSRSNNVPVFKIDVKQNQFVKQQQNLKQSQKLKQVQRFRPFRIYQPPITPIIRIGLGNFNRSRVETTKFKPKKNSFGKNKYSYAPSIEATLFGIKSKSFNKNLAVTGLTLRPIIVKGGV